MSHSSHSNVRRRAPDKIAPDHEFFGIGNLRPSMRNLVLTVIVLEQDPQPTITKEGHVVRNLLVADKSGKIRLSVWNEPGEYLIPGDIIRITRCYATNYKGILMLYIGRGGDIVRIGDFCLPFSEEPNMSADYSV